MKSIAPIPYCIDIGFRHSVMFCNQETTKRVLWQTGNTQMKCSIMLHYIRVYTVCKGKKKTSDKIQYYFLFNYSLTALDMYVQWTIPFYFPLLFSFCLRSISDLHTFSICKQSSVVLRQIRTKTKLKLHKK